MAMGKRKGKQLPLWVSFEEMKSPGHPFHRKLNEILWRAARRARASPTRSRRRFVPYPRQSAITLHSRPSMNQKMTV
jgi:hypothetical protein